MFKHAQFTIRLIFFTIRLHFFRGNLGTWTVRIDFGTRDWIGAGYIGGATAYLGYVRHRRYNCSAAEYCIGFTRNANRVPYVS